VIDSRSVTNVALGGHVNLTSGGSWIVHGGFATDRSQVGPSDTAFTKADLTRITAGLSAQTTHFLGSLGVQRVSGMSAPLSLRALPGGQLTTTLTIRSLSLLYSLSVLF
jgi:hypothetical protein